jgi:hypothetical protein
VVRRARSPPVEMLFPGLRVWSSGDKVHPQTRRSVVDESGTERCTTLPFPAAVIPIQLCPSASRDRAWIVPTIRDSPPIMHGRSAAGGSGTSRAVVPTSSRVGEASRRLRDWEACRSA